MNLNNISTNKKILALLIGVIIIVGLVVTIFLVSRSQDNRSRAAQAATLSLTPTSQPVAPGENAKLDITFNPNNEQANSIKFTLKFDPNQFDINNVIFSLDQASGMQIVGQPSYSNNGTVSYTLAVTGNDPTKVIQSSTKLGSIQLPVKSNASGGNYSVGFDDANTKASFNSNGQVGENVLIASTPVSVTVESVCQINTSTCSWDALEGATSYKVTITNTSNNTVIRTVDTSETSIDFPSTVDVTYKCEVVAKNSCGGIGEAGETSNLCPGPSTTLTPTPRVSSSPTPTTRLSSSPTPTNPSRITSTPTPTPTSVVYNSPTPETSTSPISPTPTPELPPTGNPLVIGGILGGVLILLGGLVLLIL